MKKIAIIDETEPNGITIIPVFNFYDLHLWVTYAQEHCLDVMFLGEKEVIAKSGIDLFINEPIDKPYKVIANNVPIVGLVYINQHYELLNTSFKRISFKNEVALKYTSLWSF